MPVLHKLDETDCLIVSIEPDSLLHQQLVEHLDRALLSLSVPKTPDSTYKFNARISVDLLGCITTSQQINKTGWNKFTISADRMLLLAMELRPREG